MQILTESECNDIFDSSTIEEIEKGKPDFFDDNSYEWVEWLYKNGYRIVKTKKEV